jgi:hypothetical protein
MYTLESSEIPVNARDELTIVNLNSSGGPWYMLSDVRSKTANFWHLRTHEFSAFPSASTPFKRGSHAVRGDESQAHQFTVACFLDPN